MAERFHQRRGGVGHIWIAVGFDKEWRNHVLRPVLTVLIQHREGRAVVAAVAPL